MKQSAAVGIEPTTFGLLYVHIALSIKTQYNHNNNRPIELQLQYLPWQDRQKAT